MQVKPELIEKYKKYLVNNVTNDAGLKNEKGDIPLAYTLEILTATELVGIELDEGATPQAAMDKATKGRGLTGFMAGGIASAISHYHVRGEEFKQWWNKSWGVDDPKAKGAVNPAIMTIKDPKKTKAD